MAAGFGIKEIKQFFEVSQHVGIYISWLASVILQHVRDLLVPLLVCSASPEASRTLKFIAARTNTVSARVKVQGAYTVSFQSSWWFAGFPVTVSGVHQAHLSISHQE